MIQVFVVLLPSPLFLWYIFQALINSLVCCFGTSALGLILFQICVHCCVVCVVVGGGGDVCCCSSSSSSSWLVVDRSPA